ncbi:MAG: glycoside hydrolase family 2 protein [Lachnospiraceae bacterium]|nr:glycoside hydrolase family 2 protein [Lachnospiraceae bacterium]
MRNRIKIDKNWFFTNQNTVREAVDLPHTWNALDGQDGGNDYWRGTNTYDVEFPKPNFDLKNEVVYLQFHGVNASSKVILNDNVVCTHDGGYSTFRVEVTKDLASMNKMIVEVDNSVNDRVYPQKADFTFYGGIYRDVELLVVNKNHFDLDYHGGPGIAITPEVKGKDADIRVETWANAENGIVEVTLFDAEGNVAATATEIVKSSAASVVLKVENVHLWDGLDDPYLYTVEAVLSVNGEAVDEITSTCGVRTFEFSPKDGFHLNGRPYPLHGVSRHQDFKGIGNAISRAEHDRDMALIQEVGANTIRLAHYQHDQYFYDLCDKAGMIVWAEIPYISEHLANGDANTKSQMEELIVQNYNHPCIVTWGVSNEITISGRPLKKQMLANHHVLNDLCHKMDPTRPTTLANYAMCPHWHPVAHITDLVGWNLYLGWYVPFLWLNDAWIKFWHFLYPNRCLCFSEYGAEGMPNLHSKKPKRGDNSEEYHNKYHEYMLECFKRFPYMWAHYYWNMFDFAADARNQGGEPGMNHKGLITFDRKTKKDAFYLYKAYWNKKDKFVYLAGRRYEKRELSNQTITVYSNLPEVSLYQNGKLVGTQKGENVFKFNITLEAENKLEAVAGEYKDSCVIYKVDKEPKEYYLEKGDSSNWM